MNRSSDVYYTTQNDFFPMQEENIGETTGSMKKFLRILEVVRPSGSLTDALRWCGSGGPAEKGVFIRISKLQINSEKRFFIGK